MPSLPEANDDRPAGARWLLAAALLLALVRLVHLGTWSLWHDEAIALSDALAGQRMQNPIGYVLFGLVYAWGDGRPSELELRLLPALLGILGVALTAWAFRPVAGPRRAAAAALFLAASAWHVYWSQNARFYTLTLDLGLLGGGLVLRGLWAPAGSRRGPWLVTAGLVVAGAAAATHPSAVFLLAGLVAGPWLARAVGVRPPAGRAAPWRSLVAAAVLVVAVGAGWSADVWTTWVAKKSADPGHFVLTAGFYVTPLVGVGFLLGLWVALRRREAGEVLVALVVLVGAAAALLASLRARMSAQYVFVLLPWILLVAAVPVDARRPRGGLAVSRAMSVGYLFLILLPSLAEVGLYFTVRHGDRPRWREAYRYVFDHRAPGDLILGMDAPVGEYYLDPDPDRTDVRNWRNVTFLDHFRAGVPDAWARYPRRAWFVVNLEQLEDWGSDERRQIERVLAEECRHVASFPVHAPGRDLDVLVYVREPPGS